MIMAAVFGGDLNSRVTQLGKALEDPVDGLSSLTKVGIDFTATQRDLIETLVETGRQAEAQKIILDALEQRVGGAGAGEAKGLTGATNRLSDAWNNLLEDIGQTRVVSGSAETALNGLSSAVEGIRGLFKEDTLGEKVFDLNKKILNAEERLKDLRENSSYSNDRLVGAQEARVAQLRAELDGILADAKTSAKSFSEEQRKVDAGREQAARDKRTELLTDQRKKIDEALSRLATEPAERIAKVNRELAETKERLEALREKDGSNNTAVDEAIKQAETVSQRQINVIQKPALEAAKRKAESEAQQKLNAILSEAQQVTKSTETATEAYSSELERLKGLLVEGAISQENYNRAVTDAERKLLDARQDAEAGAIRAFRTYRERAEDTASAIEEVFTNAMSKTEDAIVELVTSGGRSFKSLGDLVDSVMNDILRMTIRKSITEPLFNSIESGGFLSFLTGLLPFEQGGIMTPQGAVPLRRYASGGIATSPQLALFGEGRRPEAYVPLPDGRTIPVTLQGGGSMNVIINNNTSAKVSTEQQTNATGGRDLIVQLDEMNARLFSDPGSRSSRALSRFGGLASR